MAVCHKLRDYTAAPIIILSSSYSEATVVAALQNGADEYLAKPISDSELVARLRAILRRNSPDLGRLAADSLIFDDLKISLAHHTVHKGGRKIDLSPTEFRLLACLAREPSRVLSHQALMARVWGAEYVESRHYLRLYIRYLREKLEDDPRNPRLILSEWGLGYRFQPPGH
jgi:two-component system KDP operon response regulator KdpE